MEAQVTSLLEIWSTIPQSVRTEALNGGWYRESRRTARALAKKHGVTLSTAAGVIAALSPRVQWKVNVRLADDVLAGREHSGGFLANWEKAERIRDGERPLDVLGGPKVTSFYRAIMGDEDAAVVDTWMWKAMNLAPGSVPYEEAANAMREAAHHVGVPVAQFQAIVWTEIRGGGD